MQTTMCMFVHADYRACVHACGRALWRQPCRLSTPGHPQDAALPLPARRGQPRQAAQASPLTPSARRPAKRTAQVIAQLPRASARQSAAILSSIEFDREGGGRAAAAGTARRCGAAGVGCGFRWVSLVCAFLHAPEETSLSHARAWSTTNCEVRARGCRRDCPVGGRCAHAPSMRCCRQAALPAPITTLRVQW